MLEKTEGTRENGQYKDTCLDTKKTKQKKQKLNEQHGPHTNTGAEILKH
jgi:hypothetical protein